MKYDGRLTALTRVGDYGWEGTGFRLDPGEGQIESASLMACRPGREEPRQTELTLQESENGLMLLAEEPFSYKTAFQLTIDGECYTGDTIGRQEIETVDRFTAVCRPELWYRLYEPKTQGPHPLILILHGGGESGTDNQKQLTNNFGPAHLAEQYPECMVLAPQTPVDPRKKLAEPNGNNRTGYAARQMFGFTREYLALLCREIRGLIGEGRADASRIYITGMARGGGAALLALDVDQTLFAGCLAISPRITPDVYEAFHKRTDLPIWIAGPYVDETLDRNKHIVDAVLELKDAGHPDIHLTLYSPEELAAYGIGSDPGITLEQKLQQNHRAWILAYHNEGGVLDWLLSRRKETI